MTVGVINFLKVVDINNHQRLRIPRLFADGIDKEAAVWQLGQLILKRLRTRVDVQEIDALNDFVDPDRAQQHAGQTQQIFTVVSHPARLAEDFVHQIERASGNP